MFGLLHADIITIRETLEKHSEVTEAYLFGSRAKGNYKNGSDIDIAIKGSNISLSSILAISGFLNEETIMPYHFDVLDYNAAQNADLKDHIDRVGVLLYKR